MVNVEIRESIIVIFMHRSLDIIPLKSSVWVLSAQVNYIIRERTINNFVFNSLLIILFFRILFKFIIPNQLFWTDKTRNKHNIT